MSQLRKSATYQRVGAERFLVISPQGMGDTLECTPMIAELRRAFPSATIDVLVTQVPPKMLLEAQPKLVDDVIYLPLWERGKRQFLGELMLKRWRKRYDYSFLCYPAARFEYNLLSFVLPARKRIGHAYNTRWKQLGFLLSARSSIRLVHNVERNLDLLRMIGLSVDAPTRYSVPRAWIAPARERRPRTIMIHVGTSKHHGRESRRWPLENFAAVARWCLEQGFEVEVLMGPREEEETRFIQEHALGVTIYAGPLPSVAHRLSSSAMVIANDSGIAHLAAGVGAPVISLFGPTPLEHAPYGPTSIPLRASSCPPCFDVRKLRSRCERNIGYLCLAELTVGRVTDEVARQLNCKADSAQVVIA